MMMEIMGLHLPGSSFVNANTPLRDALTAEATRRALALTALGFHYTPIRRAAGRTGLRQRTCGPAGNGWIDEPHHAFDRHVRRSRNCA